MTIGGLDPTQQFSVTVAGSTSAGSGAISTGVQPSPPMQPSSTMQSNPPGQPGKHTHTDKYMYRLLCTGRISKCACLEPFELLHFSISLRLL